MTKPYRLPSGNWRTRWVDEQGVRRSATFETYKEA